MKITPRETRDVVIFLSATASLLSRGADFHTRSRFARSPFPEEKATEFCESNAIIDLTSAAAI